MNIRGLISSWPKAAGCGLIGVSMWVGGGGLAWGQSGNLVAAYAFNEGTGTVVTDLSGNGNNGTISGATWTGTGKYGGALVFNGTSARVTINNSASLQLTTGMTLEAWVNPTAVSSAWRDVIYKGNDNYYLEATTDHSGYPCGAGTFGTANVQAFGTSKLALNTWVHLAATYDGATLRFYVNGTQVASRAQTGNIVTSSNPLQIGGDSIYGQYFKGMIDEVRVYRAALTAAQIQTDMNTPLTATPDTQAPTVPAGLAATAVSQSQINLNWTASTDNVGVTGYLVERQDPVSGNFGQVGTATGTTYSDTGLTPATGYSYRVRARDAAGNLSGYSGVASATTATPDTQAPSAPSSLTATGVSGGQIDVSWSASTDNVGVTGYLVERQDLVSGNFGQIGTATGTAYSDTGLSPSTSYSYRVRATDGAGNLSGYSPVGSGTTLATPPGLVAAYGMNEGAGTVLTDLSGNGNNGTISGATWTGTGKYGGGLVFNGTSALVTINNSASLQLTTGMTLEAWVNPTAVSSAWRDVVYKGDDNYYLEATTDRGGVPCGAGTFGTADVQALGTSVLALNTWVHLAATYDGATLRFYVNGTQVGSLAQTGNMVTSSNPLQLGGDSIYGQFFAGMIDEVRVYRVALTAAQIQTDMNTPVGNAGPDTQPPTVPGNLAANAASGTQINLSWTASTDNVGVTGYMVERSQGAGSTSYAQVGTATGTTYNDTGLTAGTVYNYRVRATDAAGNLSGYSGIASTTTPAPDTQPPTVPGNLTANAVSGTQINLGWVASTDNVGVTGYMVERSQGAGSTSYSQIGTATGTTYSDTGLTAGTVYNYRVRATDGAGNLSGYSGVASTTTPAPDTQPPTAPGNLTANAVSGTQINLGWVASTDNVGVTGYMVERSQGAGSTSYSQIGTATGTTYSDTGLTAGTVYNYRVRATDGAGNLSGYSGVASTTTLAPDTQAPTAPSGLTATAAGTSQINLGWAASTDNVGVTGYLVERSQGTGSTSFAQIGTATGTTYNDTAGLLAGTVYNYRVRATDAAGNLSGYSAVASVTTQAGSTSLVAAYGFNEGTGSTASDASGNGNTGTLVGATWTSAGKFGGAASFSGSSYIDLGNPTSLQITGSMTISAWVYATSNPPDDGQIIAKSDSGSGLAGWQFKTTPDTGVETFGFGVSANGSSVVQRYSKTVRALNTWYHVTGVYDAAAKTMDIYVNGVLDNGQLSGTVPASQFNAALNATIGKRSGGFNFLGVIDELRVYKTALTAAQIQADMNTPVGAAGPDTQAPTAPGNLAATAVSTGEIDLSWGASTDNVGVTGYMVERSQGSGSTSYTPVGTATGTTYNDTAGLQAGTVYNYRVRATDAAGNLSGYSSVATATTPVPDTEPPTAPSGLVATAVSASQINLSWTAATDNVGVTGYRVERCQGGGCTDFVKLGYPTGTTYTDTGLQPGTSYSYIVRAVDAEQNLGPYSGVATATTLSAPPSLVAAYSFDEGTGTTVTDVSGNGNNGIISGATWTAGGRFGGALSFNGNAALVTINDSPSLRLTTGMTLEAWVNPTVVSSAWRDVVYKGNDNYYLEATTDRGGVPCGAGTLGTANVQALGTSILALNTWVHLAATYDGATLRFYVNGVQQSSLAQTGNILTSGNALQIGGDSIYGQYFSGTIDEVRVYNRALSGAEILSDMNTPVGNVPSAPGNLTATVMSANRIDLSWDPSASSVGVSAYMIERCQGTGCAGFTQVGTSTSTIYSDTGLGANTTYRYRVRAVDTAGTAGPYSVVAEGYTGLTISPRVAALTVTRTQQFSASESGVTWAVDGIAGGSATVGTITSGGLYTPPGVAGTHTVTATAQDQLRTANATVYVTTYAGTFTHHNDNFRTGQNLQETVLTPASVNAAGFGKLRAYPIDGTSLASPLYVANVSIPGQGYHNVVYVATEHDSVYAFDADGLGSGPLWQASFINPALGITPVPANDTGECCDIPNEIGITGTPVIDPTTKTLYVVAKTKEVSGGNTSYVQRLHALDIATGAEKFGGPVAIQATVSGTGNGSQGGKLSFLPLRENQRPALLLNNGIIYMAFSSHGDNQPYHGWVLGYNASTLQQTMAWCVTANGEGAGIWQSGSGLAADTDGTIYCITADGTFDADIGGSSYGDSFVRLSQAGTVVDYFTPFDQNTLNVGNIDLGSGGVMLLPDQGGTFPHLMVGAGKNATIYLINRDYMGHFQPNSDNQIVESLINIFPYGTPEPGNYSAPVYFTGVVYFSPVADTLKAFPLNYGLLTTAPTSQSAEVYTYPGGTMAISANGNANGILWAIQRRGIDNYGNGTTQPGILRAYDPTNLANEYYNSEQMGTRDTLDYAAKFSVPLVANGKVFVAGETQFMIYGLLP